MTRIVVADVFVPDRDDAQQRAKEELSKAAYEQARPTWFDEFARDVVNGIAALFSGDGATNLAPLTLTIVVVVVLAAVVVALVVWGRPRASHSRRRGSDLLGERDDRTAAQLRAEADEAARSGSFDRAVVLRFRALARGLIERDLLDPAPGATAQAISREGALVFPALADRLHDAAELFDRVRYLDVNALADDYRVLTDVDAAVAAASPVQELVSERVA